MAREHVRFGTEFIHYRSLRNEALLGVSWRVCFDQTLGGECTGRSVTRDLLGECTIVAPLLSRCQYIIPYFSPILDFSCVRNYIFPGTQYPSHLICPLLFPRVVSIFHVEKGYIIASYAANNPDKGKKCSIG